MGNEFVICIDIGTYDNALTRGKHYSVLDKNIKNSQIKIIGDNNRKRWFPYNNFVSNTSIVPILVSWEFDDNIDSSHSENFIEISFYLSDGSKRWCSICSAEGLMRYLKNNFHYQNFSFIEKQIVVKDFNIETVNGTLNYLDQHNLLIKFSTEMLILSNIE